MPKIICPLQSYARQNYIPCKPTFQVCVLTFMLIVIMASGCRDPRRGHSLEEHQQVARHMIQSAVTAYMKEYKRIPSLPDLQREGLIADSLLNDYELHERDIVIDGEGMVSFRKK